MLLFLFQIPNKIGKFDFYFSFEHILNMCWIRFFYLPIFFNRLHQNHGKKQCQTLKSTKLTILWYIQWIHFTFETRAFFILFTSVFFCHFFGALNHSSKKCMIDFFFLSRRFRISTETFQERHQCNQNLLFFFDNVWIYKVAGGKMMITFFLSYVGGFFLRFVSVSVSFSRPHKKSSKVQDNAKYFQLNDKIRENKSKSSIQNIYKICK